MDTSDPLQAVYGAMTEKQFQAIVVDALRRRGYIVWTVPDMTRTTAGLPDVVAIHPTRVPRRLLMLELKTATGRLRPAQVQAMRALQDIPGIYAAIVRPGDWLATLKEV